MKIKAVIDTLTQAIAADSTILTYCQDTFGKAPHIIVGMDWHDPPTIQIYPAIIIYDIKTERTTSRIKYLISIGIGTENNTLSHDEETNTSTYDGFIESLELKELLESFIPTLFVNANVQKAESQPMENFPIHIMTFTAILEFPLPRRNPREPV